MSVCVARYLSEAQSLSSSRPLRSSPSAARSRIRQRLRAGSAAQAASNWSGVSTALNE